MSIYEMNKRPTFTAWEELVESASPAAREEMLKRIFEIQAAGDPGGFVEGASGDIQGWNNLRRTNWFNGRYLTAESLKRQDLYLDARSRLTAQALTPGVAWGLGLRVDGANQTPVLVSTEGTKRGNGFPLERELELQRGLAFDHGGRPILVSSPFRFTIEQLIGTYQKRPRQVVGGGIEFAPCVCLTPDPAGPSGGGALAPSGPYLLVIEGAEQPEGEAKVMGDLCSKPQPANCQADSWRGGFGLSLVRFPVELPERADLRTAWDLRGTLSAYFFDLFEHPLFKRWDPEFALNSGFCAASGPGRHDGAAVALAMLYLAEDGSVAFLDQWIPRRTICGTPAEAWHRTRFGAPPRAAAWARIHQFQCMLAESLAREPLRPTMEADRPPWIGLLARGFRHIPPIGFLPITPDGSAKRESKSGIPLFDRLLALGDNLSRAGLDLLVSPLVAHALEQARGYFVGTNVIAYGVVALHDDDILEDLANTFDKDPIQLGPTHWEERLAALLGPDYQLENPHDPNLHGYGIFTGGFYVALSRLFYALGLEQLVNRRTEIVKLVVPLQGLTRQHPLLGRIETDAMPQTALWGVNPLSTAGGPLANPNPALFGEASNLAGIVQELGLDMLPRHFVVYVKQRLVLLDLLFYVLEIFQVVMEFVLLALGASRHSSTNAATGGNQLVTTLPTTEQYHQAFMRQPAEKRAMVAAVLGQPEVQESLVQAAKLVDSEMLLAGRNLTFKAQVADREAALAAVGISDSSERQRLALAEVTDAYAAEYPDYQVLQILAATQPPAGTLTLVDRLSVAGPSASGPTLADELTPGGPTLFEGNASRTLYAELRSGLDGMRVKDLVPAATSELTTKELLSRSPEEAQRLLGGALYEQFRAAFSAERAAAREGAEALAKGLPAELVSRLESEVASGRGAAEAIAGLKLATELTPETRLALAGAERLLQLRGGGIEALRPVLRRPQG